MSSTLFSSLKRSTTQQKITETAVKWFLRMRDAEPDHPERGRFEAWLMASRTHADEYHAVADVWQDFDSKENLKSLANAVTQKQYYEQVTRTKRTQKMVSNLLGIALIAVTSLLGVAGYERWQATPTMQMAQVTKVGEQLSQTLEDGSSLFINGNSDVSVTYYRNKRLVKLNRGEVIFEVTKDADRPFIVDSGYAKVTVLGTRFAVNRLAQMVRVSVDHGRVRVESLPDPENHKVVVLHDGQVAEIKMRNNPVIVQRSAAEAFNFKQGALNFEYAGLDEIAEVLSRYRKPAVQATLMPSGNPHVTAVVKVKDIEKFLWSLPEITSVTLQSTPEATWIKAQPQK
jgi:transmembrane sensor